MSTTTDWNSNLSRAFGEAQPQDEFYHGWGPEGDSLTETWYWGFNIPEQAINCFIYCWCHPNLEVVTAGLIIYQRRFISRSVPGERSVRVCACAMPG